jgi:hypothetical protein
LTAAVLAAIPSPDRGVWHLGPVPIRAYALCILAGIVLAVRWGERRFVARGGERGAVIDIAAFAVPFGLVGGRGTSASPRSSSGPTAGSGSVTDARSPFTWPARRPAGSGSS